ncbi:MAG: CCA tRNA nucleotidyltransferase [[Clostridium] fimetarium]|nr:CCA tRNA nucleotidyltransferase [[Clostridium] fimetarium]
MIVEQIDKPIFHTVGEVADELGRECYAVGGYVRDLFLRRESKDIDFVTVGSGIEVARAVGRRMRGAHVAVFKNFGTAQVKGRGVELEFVGARRESYKRDSRKPIVEDGTLDDDLARRDFTINAMAVCVNAGRFGELIDKYNGMADLCDGLIRTPLDPDITFSDDPLRMMRAIRFATQLGFTIVEDTFKAICRNAGRISIISRERVADELMKIMRSRRPSRGWELLLKSGLLKLIFPELAALRGVEVVKGVGHKDNFYHTLAVLDNVAERSDNVWLRWGALLHDIAKPVTKRFDQQLGWTFHGHNAVGAKMIPRIFRRMKLPMNEHMKYVQKLVDLHMRPIALVEDEVTDSAVRRLLFDAGDDIDDLMILCSADITSKNREKVERFRANYELVKQKMVELEERDRIRNFQPPVNGLEVMETFGLGECREVGVIKERIKNAILDGEIPNDHSAARDLMLRFAAAELGLKPAAQESASASASATPSDGSDGSDKSDGSDEAGA